jgi:hypothetical protein
MKRHALLSSLLISLTGAVAGCSGASPNATSSPGGETTNDDGGGVDQGDGGGGVGEDGGPNKSDAGATKDGGGKDSGSSGNGNGSSIYVSPSGNDANPGTQVSPLKTLAAAIAKAASAPGTAVRACNGTYAESLELDSAIAMFGGYDCTSWARAADYGAPKWTGTTVVKSAAPIHVAPSADGSSIDGFTFQEDAFPTDPNVIMASAVDIDTAKVTFTNNVVVGFAADASSSTFASSEAMYVANSASEIASNRIVSASPTKTNADGLKLADADANVHDNTILGGAAPVNGTQPTTNAALSIENPSVALTNPVKNNQLLGNASAVSKGGTGGVIFMGTAATFSGNTIDGGDGVFAAIAFDIQTATALRIVDNRISTGTSANPTGDFVKKAIFAESQVKGAEISNNFIVGVRTSTAMPSQSQCAVIEIDGAGVDVLDNTIHSGVCNNVHVIDVLFGSKGARIENNLLLAADSTGVLGIQGVSLDKCLNTATAIGTVKNNAFVNFPQPGIVSTKTAMSCNDASPADVSALETALAGQGATASNNVMVRKACGAADGARCSAQSACTSSGACIRTVLSAFTDTTTGDTELLAGGFTLKTGAPCIVTKGASDLSASTPAIASDFFGTARTATASIGANEMSGTCQ